MAVKKILSVCFLVLITAAFLHSQSLTDLAKKEKARRAQIKGKTTGVVTNADLARLKKKAAVESPSPETAAEPGEAVQGEPSGEPPDAAGQPAAAPQPEPKPEEPAPEAEKPLMSEKDFKAKLAEHKAKVDEAQDLFDMLTLKLNALQAQFYNFSDMTVREQIQNKISETYQKLTKAQEDLAKAQTALDDFASNSRREGIPQIWIH